MVIILAVYTLMLKPIQDHIIKIGALSAVIATISLVILALLPRPFIPVDHFSALAQPSFFTDEQFAVYKEYVSNNLTIDSIYLLAHSIMWVGLANLVATRITSMRSPILTFGLLSAFLDFLENELRWGAITLFSSGGILEPSYAVIWNTILGLSFWMLFVASLFTGLGVAGIFRYGNIVAVWSMIGVIAASSIYKVGFLPSFLWLIIWHALCAFFLWNNRNQTPAITPVDT